MATIVLVTASGVAALASEQTAAAAPPTSTCQLGNGVKHVVSLVFDNVHFFRDNPNVPSDLEQMPHLLNFLKSNGTVLSNVHTPLIAHTADDSLTIYTGLYGDRHGQPVSNSYKTYNPDGPRHDAEHGVLRHGSGDPGRDRSTDPCSLGAVHAGRVHGRRFLHRQHGAGKRPARYTGRIRA
jgi:hypothetical protein